MATSFDTQYVKKACEKRVFLFPFLDHGGPKFGLASLENENDTAKCICSKEI